MTVSARHSLILGWSIALLAVLGAVILWLGARPWSVRVVNVYAATASLGQILGLTGFVLLAITIILNSRLRFLDRFFGGLDVVYQMHHQVGAVTVLLLIAHPLLVAAKYLAISWHSASVLLLPTWSNIPVLYGIGALFSLECLIILTMFIKLRYRLWRFIHQLLGTSIVLAWLHVYNIPSDTSISRPLQYYLLSWMTLALIIYLYRTVLGTWLIPRHRYVVDAVQILPGSVVDISLNPIGRGIDPQPGQHVFISFLDSTIGRESHPFSLASAAHHPRLRVAIKNLGGYTKKMPLLRPGTPAMIEGPFGALYGSQSAAKSQVWIAGGIGITPFLGLAASLPAKHGPVDVWYCTENSGEAVYLPELQARAKSDPAFRVIPFYSAERGHVSGTILQQTSAVVGRDVWLCAPPRMMHDLERQLVQIGVEPGHIHTEEFSFL